MRKWDSATQEMAGCCIEIEFDTFVVKVSAKLIVTLVANSSCICFHAQLRIEVHFFVCIGKTLVTCKSCEARSDSRRFTHDQCPFNSQCKQRKSTSILIFMLKR